MAVKYYKPSRTVNGAGTSFGDPTNVLPTLNATDELRVIPRDDGGVDPISYASGTWLTVGNPDVTIVGAPECGKVRPRLSLNASASAGNGLRFTSGADRGKVLNLTFEDSNVCPVSAGDISFTARHLKMRNVGTSSGPNFIGVTVGSSTALSTSFNNTVVVDDVDIDGVGCDGIFIYASDSTKSYVENCKVANVSQHDSGGDCVQVSGPGLLTVVRNNKLDHSSNSAKQAFIQSNTSDTLYPNSRVILLDNELIGWPIGELGISGSFNKPVYSSQKLIALRNYLRGSGPLMVAKNGSLVRSNLFISSGIGAADTATGMWLQMNSGVNKVYNNTFIKLTNTGALDVWDSGVRFESTVDPTSEFRNNIVVGANNGVRRGSTLLESGNLFFNCVTPIISGGSVVSPNSLDFIGVDPQLDAEWIPKAGSTAIGSGVIYETLRQTNILGRLFSSPPNRGCF